MKSSSSTVSRKATSSVKKTISVKRVVKKNNSFKKAFKKVCRETLLSSTFQKTCKLLSLAVMLGVISYGTYQFVNKSFANEVVISKSEIVSRVGELTTLPEHPPIDVVRVEDEEGLKKQNDFYKDVKEGDYIVMYDSMVIVYNLRKNSIIAMRSLSK